ncbi:MAG: TrkA C-terminal domain-containing protein [Planctomycetes bacterium]|nr:TrkA C-terminal domain-containing protein [Planctomycetota bacterium]
MLSLVAVFLVLSVSLLIVRIGTVALVLTGLSPQIARFQARSTYFGVGFTTLESEKVINNPVRREILLTLMLLGNAGVITLIGSLVVTFVQIPDEGLLSEIWFRGLVISCGIALVVVMAYSKWIDRRLSPIVAWALHRFTRLDAVDYSEMLHLEHDYSVAEFVVRQGDWMCGRALTDLRLGDEGVMILGIKRQDGQYLGAPKGSAMIFDGDEIIVYGKLSMLRILESRRAGSQGDREHEIAVEKKQEIE